MKTDNKGIIFFTGLILLFLALSIPQIGIIPQFRAVSHLAALAFLGGSYFYFKATAFGGMKRFVIAFLIWGTTVGISVIVNHPSPLYIIQVMRFTVLLPIALFMLGYVASNVNRRFVPYVFLFSGLANAVLMYLSIANTPRGLQTPDGKYTGEQARIYLHYLDSQSWVNGPTVMAYAIGAVLCLFFVAYKRNYFVKGIFAVSFMLAVYLAIRSGTRTALLATLLSFSALVFVATLKRQIPLGKIGVACLLCGFIGLAAGVWLDWGSLALSGVERFRPENILDATATGRTYIWAERAQAALMAPLGNGYGVIDYLDERSTHNNFIEVFFAFGWFAGATYVVLMGLVGWRMFKITLDQHPSFYHTVFAYVVLAQIVLGMFEATIRSSHISFFTFCFSIGCLFSPVLARRSKGSPPTMGKRYDVVRHPQAQRPRLAPDRRGTLV